MKIFSPEFQKVRYLGLACLLGLGAVACSGQSKNPDLSQRTHIEGPLVPLAALKQNQYRQIEDGNTRTVALLERAVESDDARGFKYSNDGRDLNFRFPGIPSGPLGITHIHDICDGTSLKRKIDYTLAGRIDRSFRDQGTAFIVAPSYPACADEQLSPTETYPPVRLQDLAVNTSR